MTNFKTIKWFSNVANDKNLVGLHLSASFMEDYGMKLLCEALSHAAQLRAQTPPGSQKSA